MTAEQFHSLAFGMPGKKSEIKVERVTEIVRLKKSIRENEKKRHVINRQLNKDRRALKELLK